MKEKTGIQRLATASSDKEQKQVKEYRFKRRESMLTLIYNSSGGKVLYSIILSSVFVLFLVESIRYWYRRELLYEDLSFLVRCFDSIHVFFYSWFSIHIPIFGILFPAAKVMMKHAGRLPFILSAFATLLVIGIIPLALLMIHKTSEVVRTMMVMEQVRVFMKVIAYSVEICRTEQVNDVAPPTPAVPVQPDGSNNDNMSEVHKTAQMFGSLVGSGRKSPADDKGKRTEDIPTEPTVKALLYFLFAPTLIYRPTYPSLGRARSFRVIRKCATDISMLMFVTLVVHRRHYEPIVNHLGAYPMSQLSADTVLSIFLWSTIMGWLCLLGIGFGFLHCWLNIWAELLDFGDRQFYKSWWECRGIDEFMRTWNYLIHSWISSYIFKPTISITKSKQISLLVVILVSAFIHDYIMSVIGGVATSIFSAVVICIVIPTFLLALPANYMQGNKGVNFFTFFVLTLTATVMGLMGGSEYVTRLVNCVNPQRSPFNIMPGIFDCEY